MASEDGCLFCRIVAGDVPAEIVRIGERVVAFRDLNPQAPLHALVVPRDHHEDVAALAAEDPEALAELVEVGRTAWFSTRGAARARASSTCTGTSWRGVLSAGRRADAGTMDGWLALRRARC
jgi:hypothetical protein